MPSRIEDYALIGDCQTAALAGRDGSIDWLCFPRFDSGACFAALLGSPDNGRWKIAPDGELKGVRRRYRDGTLILETEFETPEGSVRLIDLMPPRDGHPSLVRVVEGVSGEVRMKFELTIRFDYGSIIPWVQRVDGGISAIAGPDMLRLLSDVKLRGENFETVAEFSVREGQRVGFEMTWFPSHRPEPSPIDIDAAIRFTEDWWREWSGRCSYNGPWREGVVRSLITLKALTYAPTGGIAAAATTSLPEWIGSVRNWDYRYCWIRDATFSLLALLQAGYLDEARAWREWLLRAVAGKPENLQIMYGLSGERRLTELELGWLPGYEGSRPVRIGNAASSQFQLDVYGEMMDTFFQALKAGLEPLGTSWNVVGKILDFLETNWSQPDEGIWEVRGPRRHFTHSKVMAWVAFDRAVKGIEQFGRGGPVDRFRATRDAIHQEVRRLGYNAELASFTQYYGSSELDASLLMIPLVGFLPATDPRVRGTVEAIERRLCRDGFVARYDSGSSVDGLPVGEGVFLPCSFWLADNLALLGRYRDARTLFEKLLAIRNDVGLLAEEYDPKSGRLLGNFPQAFSHIGLICSAFNLSHEETGPASSRKEQ